MHYLIKPWLPAGQLHLLSGRSGVGKTHLLFQLIAEHRAKLGEIAYFSGDRAAASLVPLFENLKCSWPVHSLVDRPFEQAKEMMQIEDYLKPFKWLDGIVKQSKPTLVVVDPAQRFVPCKDLNRQASAAGGLTFLAGWARTNDLTLILVWHPSKVATGLLNDPFDSIAGSHAIQGYTSSKAMLEQTNKELFRITLRGQHFADQAFWAKRTDNGFFAWTKAPDSELLALFPAEGEHIDAFSLLASWNGSRRSFFYHLRKLISEGLVEHCGRGRYRRTKQKVPVKH